MGLLVLPKWSKEMSNQSQTFLCTQWNWSHIFCGVVFSWIALTSVAVPYSSVPQMQSTLQPISRQYLAQTSAERTAPTMLPRWGLLLTQGRAEVMSLFLVLGEGSVKLGWCFSFWECTKLMSSVLTAVSVLFFLLALAKCCTNLLVSNIILIMIFLDASLKSQLFLLCFLSRVESLHERLAVDLFYVLYSILGKCQLVPRHKQSPLDPVPKAFSEVGNGSVFSHLYHLLVLHYFSQLGVNIVSTTVVLASRITVITNDINLYVSWIPFSLRSAPNPDQVVKLMVIRKPIIHHAVKSDGCNVRFRSPPEPFPACFMQGSPQHRYFTTLQLLQLDSYSVEISYRCIIFSCILHYCLCYVKISVVGIESTGSELTAERRKPVPEKYYYPLSLCLAMIPVDRLVSGAVVIGLPVEPRVMGRVVLHVKASHNGFESCF